MVLMRAKDFITKRGHAAGWQWSVWGGGMCAVVSNLVFASLVSGKRDSRQQVWCFGNSSNVFFLCLLHGIESHSGGNVQGQEPKSRSLQLLYIPVTAFSQTALFLDRISLK